MSAQMQPSESIGNAAWRTPTTSRVGSASANVRKWRMSFTLPAGPPLEPPAQPVGHRSVTLVDATRADRTLPLDCWYPAAAGTESPSVYELLPGIGFTASAGVDAPVAPGAHPLIVWSHGRVGTRSSYVDAVRGPRGARVRGRRGRSSRRHAVRLDDRDRGRRRHQRDATGRRRPVRVRRRARGPVRPRSCDIDDSRIAVAGHSYGAWTAYAFAGRIRSIAASGPWRGSQPFTRTLRRRVIGRSPRRRCSIAGAKDQTTPPDVDADRAFACRCATRYGSISRPPGIRRAATSGCTSSSRPRWRESPRSFSGSCRRWRTR